MAPARGHLEAGLAQTGYAEPVVPVLANITAEPYGVDVAATLSAQLTAPVRWRGTLAALDVEQVLEVGPGGVLMLRMSEESFTGVLDANLTGAYRVAKRASRSMLERWAPRVCSGVEGNDANAQIQVRKAMPLSAQPGEVAEAEGGDPVDQRREPV